MCQRAASKMRKGRGWVLPRRKKDGERTGEKEQEGGGNKVSERQAADEGEKGLCFM